MELNVATLAGASGESAASKDVEVSDAVFARDYQQSLVHQVVVAHLAGARQGSVQQKSRSDARGGGRKPWRQKRLGRARAGTIRSPIWRGGGVTFAARPRDYSQKVNRKMYRGAMRSIISELHRSERLTVIDDLVLEAPKTRDLVALLASLQVTRPLIVHHDPGANLILAARNLPEVAVFDAREINPVALLSHESLLITEAALRVVEEVLS
ncbi:MAG: 50S ribosomal protein L4 [Gammaproteobacteria bacterium]|nr:50S ribosomal protein L4 [Gammaproteobacteria bacterium]